MLHVICLAGEHMWGTARLLSSFPGVTETVSGHAYGENNRHEAVKVTFDDSILPLSLLLETFAHAFGSPVTCYDGTDMAKPGVSLTGEQEMASGHAIRMEGHTRFLLYEGTCREDSPFPPDAIEKTRNSLSLDIIADSVRKAGVTAREMQGKITRMDKPDGSPVTQADLAISERIIRLVSILFPDCGIISEEHLTEDKKDAPYTFVLDPIDGTDVYSQGFPSFAVALGVLDHNRMPVGAYISAPRFGVSEEELFIRLDPGKELFLNGKPFQRGNDKDVPRQITMGSNALHLIDATGCKVKLRCLGSSILHLLAPVVFSKIDGCVETTGYIWDVAASHAVLMHEGMEIVHADGSPFVYDERLFQRKPYVPPIYAGTPKGTRALREIFTLTPR